MADIAQFVVDKLTEKLEAVDSSVLQSVATTINMDKDAALALVKTVLAAVVPDIRESIKAAHPQGSRMTPGGLGITCADGRVILMFNSDKPATTQLQAPSAACFTTPIGGSDMLRADSFGFGK